MLNILSNWYQQVSETAKLNSLRRELLTLVHAEQDTADRLISTERYRQPGKSETWYLEKVIYDLRRGR